MKTTEDVPEGGLYASACCGVEVIVAEGATFTRCPQCQRLCEWEMEFIATARRNSKTAKKKAA
jgi:hypothetical protein